jgi:xylulokinase
VIATFRAKPMFHLGLFHGIVYIYILFHNFSQLTNVPGGTISLTKERIHMHLIGIDIGSSFVKACVIDAPTGKCVGAASFPEQEMIISSPKPGWAEQDPNAWWTNASLAVKKACAEAGVSAEDIKGIGVAYQMHGLVLLDKNHAVLRPAIIWCDGRAVEIGNKALKEIGQSTCLSRLLNSPGNFTASKLKWVKENEPDIFGRAHAFCLPGDYIALKLTGQCATTVSGLSEGILWDFSVEKPASILLDHYGIPESFIPKLVPTFGHQGELTADAAKALGLKAGTPVTYRAGDQPNNAFSLNVLEPGDIAATAGTSGVMYGVTDTVKVDPESRVNTFVHVNHSEKAKRLGVLLCVNGAGIANAWIKRLLGPQTTYKEMDALSESIAPGSDGLTMIPFGNGAERMIGNRDIGARLCGLQFNRHNRAHISRAVQEGIAFALAYGVDIMRSIGVNASRVRAGRSNMFISRTFCDTIAGVLNAPIELYNTDGAQGAARGAGIGAGVYHSPKAAFSGLRVEAVVEPHKSTIGHFSNAYGQWKEALSNCIG